MRRTECARRRWIEEAVVSSRNYLLWSCLMQACHWDNAARQGELLAAHGDQRLQQIVATRSSRELTH